jgi:hypothetical protein
MLLAFAAGAGGFLHGAIGFNGKPARLLPPAVDGPSQPAPESRPRTASGDGRGNNGRPTSLCLSARLAYTDALVGRRTTPSGLLDAPQPWIPFPRGM